MEEPYNTTIFVTLVIYKEMETPATKVQSSFCFFRILLRFYSQVNPGDQGGGQHTGTVGGHDAHRL